MYLENGTHPRQAKSLSRFLPRIFLGKKDHIPCGERSTISLLWDNSTMLWTLTTLGDLAQERPGCMIVCGTSSLHVQLMGIWFPLGEREYCSLADLWSPQLLATSQSSRSKTLSRRF